MEIVSDDNNYLELDNFEKQDLVYDSLEKKVKLDPKVTASGEENINESKS